jgi:hypothetical protein
VRFLLTALLLLPVAAPAQQPAPATAASKVIGTVQTIEAQAGKAQIRNDAGAVWTVDISDKTLVLRVPPGERDLKKASRIPLTDVTAGDRVLARGPAGADPNSLTATSLIVMTKADIAQKEAHDQAEWQRRGIGGVVTAVDPAAQTVTVNVRSMGTVKPVTIQLASGAVVRRYAPDSVKFADAKPSTLAEIGVGDQVRALGDRSEDGTHFTAEELVSGAFRTIPAQVVSTDPAADTVVVQNLENKQTITVHVNQDTLMRRIPEEMARMMAMRLHSGAAGGPPGAAGQPGSGGPPSGGQSQRPPGSDTASGGPGGGWRQGGGAARRGDLQQMLERMPPVTIADLKKGDALIISSSASADTKNITAINLIAGVEPFLAAAPRTAGGQYNLGSWNLDMNGGMPGE